MGNSSRLELTESHLNMAAEKVDQLWLQFGRTFRG